MSESKKYNPSEIEKKWQDFWQENKTYQTKDISDKKFYILDMFPYPSGEGLHVGHPKGYIATDVYSRMKRMQGADVLHPMGFDAFGLPAEQFAIKNKVNPKVATDKNVARYKEQLEMIGLDYDWDREVNTTDPDFYKWTQWMWKQMYKKGLAYESYDPVNWCPTDKTVLANEDLDGNVCERCGTVVEKKSLRQWTIRITDYADRLLEDLDSLDWEPHIKELQKNWIGKSEGAEIDFELLFTKNPKDNDNRGPEGAKAKFTVFTTRPDTLFGVTYLVIAPEHPWLTLALDDNHDVLNNKDEVKKYVESVKVKTDIERTDHTKEKTGVLLDGVFAVHPLTKEEIPIYTADYVLAHYGTGVVMAVPAHDERDFGFATKYNLPIKEVIRPYVVDHVNAPRENKETIVRENVHAIVRDPKTDRYLILRNAEHGWDTVVIGGIENGEDPIQAALREVREETGYTNLKYIRTLGSPVQAGYFAKHKDQNRVAISTCVYFELVDDTREEIVEDEGNEILWIDKKDFIPGKMINSELSIWLERLNNRNTISEAILTFGEVKKDAVRRDRVGVVIIKNNKVLCEKLDTKGTKFNGKYLLIGGGIEKGEKPEETVIREIQEELSIDNPTIISKLGTFETGWYSNPRSQNRIMTHHIYHVDIDSNDISENTDEAELVWVDLGEFILDANSHNKEDQAYAVRAAANSLISKYFGKGVLINSSTFDGLSSDEAKEKITQAAGGKIKSQYKLRDWVFARQRYWGEPFPIVFDENGKHYAVADSELPVKLPDVEKYEPTDTGESPLAAIESFVNVYGHINSEGEFESLSKDDIRAKLFRRETNTMPQWAGSSWYYLRYIDPHNKETFVDKTKEEKWSPVDFYVGGAEHATRHLIYARFWHKFLYDQGLVSKNEPFTKLQTVGLIMAEDGRKMSKRWGNVVNPDDVVREYGADTLRLYEMFMGPFEQSVAWSTKSMSGSKRFLDRVWKLAEKISESGELSSDTEILFNQTIKKVTTDILEFKHNTAIAALMTLQNSFEKENTISKIIFESYLKLIAPFAPHITEELWFALGNQFSIHTSVWPDYDENKLQKNSTTISIQVNGKLRGTVEVPFNEEEQTVVELAKREANVARFLEGKEIKKEIVVKNKLVSFVV